MTISRADIIRRIAWAFPALTPHLSARARWIIGSAPPFAHTDGKTYDYFLSRIENLIHSVYDGFIGGMFIDLMANLISGQLRQAYEQAWIDDGNDPPIPDYLAAAADDAILAQYDFVDQFYRDIVDARVDQTPIDPLLARAALWANRWNEAYHDAVILIQKESGGKSIWKLGATEVHCETCARLDGVVDYASVWHDVGLHPQGAPNDKLECEGWNCDCTLLPTDERRTPGGLYGMGF